MATDMTAAIRIRTAIELLQRAANDMDRAGVAGQALQRIDDLVAELQEESEQLPDKIIDLERDRCASCEHYRQETMREPYGNGTAPRQCAECSAKRSYQCPVVQACGFTDPADPLPDVPAFLRRQAE